MPLHIDPANTALLIMDYETVILGFLDDTAPLVESAGSHS